MLALKPAASVLIELNQIADGVKAFYNKENPQPDWSPAKLDGWNTAGIATYGMAMAQEEEAGWPEDWRSTWVGE
jgi:hypothetical protein